MNNEIKITNFSSYLFWDVDISLLDFSKSKSQIIYKIVEFGQLEDWKLLQKVYTLDEIKKETLQFRSLDVVTLSYLAHFFKIDKTQFRCYKHNQLIQNSWNS
ncbi:DUF6922 domain-containing protein [Flavobacterium sp.]|uniref:DUF6922 domain-containing protein n=1 Tax=Flavobacterium sp. TaxID=239 RepID=UPI003751C434